MWAKAFSSSVLRFWGNWERVLSRHFCTNSRALDCFVPRSLTLCFPGFLSLLYRVRDFLPVMDLSSLPRILSVSPTSVDILVSCCRLNPPKSVVLLMLLMVMASILQSPLPRSDITHGKEKAVPLGDAVP